MKQHPKVLIVDLNNFAAYPTLAIGSLVASLRKAQIDVEVLCPLSHDIPAMEREHVESRWDQFQRRIYFSTNPALEWSRHSIRALRSWWISRPHPGTLREVSRALETSPDIVLLSAYLNHYTSCVEIARRAKQKGIPVLLGGPVFNIEDITAQWLDIPGVTAIVGGEMDRDLPGLVNSAVNGEDLLQFAGVFYPDGRRSPTPPPLRDLDDLPVPDFSDFPWDRYRQRVIPVMAGRGCGWGQCVFCGDVVTANGRKFRSKKVEPLLRELKTLSEIHETKNFILLDIKLNSDVRVWRGLIENIQAHIPGACWVGTIHVDERRDNGLSRDDLVAAKHAGMMRINFGLESGSQSLLNAMRKGCNLEKTSDFIKNAYEAGISVRTTMMQGFPGETADDLKLTIDYLEQHQQYLDRVRLSQFKAIPGTKIHRDFEEHPSRYSDLVDFQWDFRKGQASYSYRPSFFREYRRAKRQLLDKVHEINKKPLRCGAEAFDGLM